MALETNLILRKYDSLPEWLRWIICWPISAIFAVIVWWLLFLLYGQELFTCAVKLAHPMVVQVAFLMAIYFTVPRWQTGFVLTFIILRTLFLLFFVVFTPLLLLGGRPPEDVVRMDWEHWWGPFLGEVITLAASIGTYRVLREYARERRQNIGALTASEDMPKAS